MPESHSKRSSRSDAAETEDSIDSFLQAAAGEGSNTGRELQRALASSPGPGLTSGQVVGQRYRLERAIGAGGMGVVWSATHVVTQRRVALKFLKGSAHVDEDFRRRFMREARATAAVQHPNVVQILDWFELEGAVPVLVMELLCGETLAQRLARSGRLDPEQTAAVLLPVVSAVGAAHGRGIVHRDLKPENIFLVDGEREPDVKVLDFGVAKLMQPSDEPGDAAVATVSGAMLGTPCYMAPEQALGERDLDHRVDVWALGAIAYECLAGVRAVAGSNIAQVVLQVTGAGVAPIARVAPELPAELCAIVDSMTARERDARPSLYVISSTLERFTSERAPALASTAPLVALAPTVLAREPVGARPRRRLAALMIASCGLALLVALALQRASVSSGAPPSRTPAAERAVPADRSPAVASELLAEPSRTPVVLAPIAPPPVPAADSAAPALAGRANARRARKRALPSAPPPAQAEAPAASAPAGPTFRGGLAERVPF